MSGGVGHDGQRKDHKPQWVSYEHELVYVGTIKHDRISTQRIFLIGWQRALINVGSWMESEPETRSAAWVMVVDVKVHYALDGE